MSEIQETGPSRRPIPVQSSWRHVDLLSFQPPVIPGRPMSKIQETGVRPAGVARSSGRPTCDLLSFRLRAISPPPMSKIQETEPSRRPVRVQSRRRHVDLLSFRRRDGDGDGDGAGVSQADAGRRNATPAARNAREVGALKWWRPGISKNEPAGACCESLRDASRMGSSVPVANSTGC